MRDDMAKVVTERPRRGHGNASKKTTGPRIRAYDPDRDYDEPTRLPIARGRQYGYDCKEFSDLLNPLKRYLRSCIGQPWNKIHSKLSRKLDRRSLSGSHIWDHVMWEIETDKRLTAWHLATPVSFVSGLCLSRLERPLSRGLLFGAAPSAARLLRAQLRSNCGRCLPRTGSPSDMCRSHADHDRSS